MNEPVLVDTGPLVAMLRESDLHHAACIETSEAILGPAITTWPVITEAAWILRKEHSAVYELLRYVELQLVDVVELGPEAARWIAAFHRKYTNVGPQLADASLMYLAETRAIDRVFTLDRRDFSIYRSRGRALTLLP
jgi:predicted nucleic acid-binding protein